MKTACMILSLITLFASLSAEAEVFRWTDKNGKANYSDLPPPEIDAQSRRLYDSKIEQDKIPFEARKAGERYPITLYVDASCKEICSNARQWLQKRKAPFKEVMLKTPEEGEALKKITGKKEIFLPTVTIGSQTIEGYESGAWGSALDLAGYPK
jgi:glutaredoxin